MRRIKNSMCRSGIALLALLLIFCLPAGAEGSAAETEPESSLSETAPYVQIEEKTITLTAGGKITMEPEGQAAFWEYPLLQAGEVRRAGTLRLVNAGDKAVNFRLSQIDLPYGNVEALTYLDALRITVTEGETVLYDGTYSRIADSDGLQLEMENWQPGSERVLTIRLRCEFGYAGEPETVSVPISWAFSASYQTGDGEPSLPTTPALEEKKPVASFIISCVAGGLVILCAVAGAVGVTVRYKRRKKQSHDPQS